MQNTQKGQADTVTSHCGFQVCITAVELPYKWHQRQQWNVKTGHYVQVNTHMLMNVQVLQMIMANRFLHSLLGSRAQGNQKGYPSASDFYLNGSSEFILPWFPTALHLILCNTILSFSNDLLQWPEKLSTFCVGRCKFDEGLLGGSHISVQFCSLHQNCCNFHSSCWSENRKKYHVSGQPKGRICLLGSINWLCRVHSDMGSLNSSPIDEMILEAEVLNLSFMLPSYWDGSLGGPCS